ncbi:alpha/beta hydrolase family protein [Sphingomonas sp. LT1P40]|uniref:alpha/beta hydrolase family protein n=1 Tax=Alteristakelama amylovorans TaxID=3096166 RepID=UPI002FCA2741
MLIPLLAIAAQAAAVPCEPGVYADRQGRNIVIMERPDTAQTGAWRWWTVDGRFGLTNDGTVTCREGAVDVKDGSVSVAYAKVPLRLTRTKFKSGNLTLNGLLVEPSATGKAKPPLVVLVHGSERTPAVRHAQHGWLLAAQGISAFIYDKRGTGDSEGSYNQDFHALAADTAAAAKEAKRLAAGRYARFGLYGGSQGGWVAPRAANDAGAEFVAIGFGLLINPLEEDAAEVRTELVEAGHGADVLANAREVTDATGALMAAHFAEGYEKLAAVKARYGKEPWFAKIKGEFTGDILALDEATLRREGRAKFDNLGIDWRYDAMGWLRKAKMPQLWVIAAEDREAPPQTTVDRLQTLRREGQDIAIVRFPGTDHGMVEFTQAPDGARTTTRVTDGYFRLVADWIKGRTTPPYGRGEFVAK